jgi:hypothetical protein
MGARTRVQNEGRGWKNAGQPHLLDAQLLHRRHCAGGRGPVSMADTAEQCPSCISRWHQDAVTGVLRGAAIRLVCFLRGGLMSACPVALFLGERGRCYLHASPAACFFSIGSVQPKGDT